MHRIHPHDPDLKPINRRCQCPGEGKRPAFFIYAPTARAIAQQSNVASSTPFATSRCGKCKGVLMLTVGDCHLAPLRGSS